MKRKEGVEGREEESGVRGRREKRGEEEEMKGERRGDGEC